MSRLTIAVVGAGGKMGMRVSNNLQRSDHTVYYAENSPAGQQRTIDAGRSVTDIATAVADAGIVILAVPDIALAPVSADIAPQLRPGTVVLTLDPAAAYASGREKIIKSGWKSIFDDGELDHVLTRMLHLDEIKR